MHIISSCILLASALAASAGAVPRHTSPVWHATNFIWGSSPGGTSGVLNLAGAAGYVPGAPAFAARCSPILVQRGWVGCRAPDGGALPATERVEMIWTSGPELGRFYFGAAHVFRTDAGAWVNVTARADIEVPAPQGNTAFEFPVISVEVLDGEPPSPT